MTDVKARRSPGAAAPGLLLGVLATAQLMLVLDVTVVNVALPDIAADLRLPAGAVPWVMTTYTLCFGGFMLVGGRVADLLGPRRAVLAALVSFVGTSLLSGLAPTATTLLVGRAGQGLSAALLSPAALGLVVTAYPGESRGRAMRVWSALSGAGSALGVVLGGVLTSELSWRWIFMINAPIGAAVFVAVLALRRCKEPTNESNMRNRHLDVVGAALVTTATGSAIYGLTDAAAHGWRPATAFWLAGALALYGCFAWFENRTAEPLLPVRLLTARPVQASAWLMLVATGLMVGGFYLGSFSLQRAHHMSAAQVGLEFLPIAVAVVAGAHTAGHLLAKTGTRHVAAAGLALAAVGEATAAHWSSATGTVTGLAVAAFGIGITFVTAFTVGLADAEPSASGLRSALVNTFHELGGGFGIAVLTAAAGSVLEARPDPHGFAHAFTVATVIAAIGAVLAVVAVPTTTTPPPGAHH